MSTRPFRVLFVCEDNGCRSQMAEGWLRALGGAGFVARSAGTEPRHLDPLATAAMQQAGVDTGAQRGKGMEAVSLERFDLVVTLGDGARGACPPLPGNPLREHHHFDDPSWMEDPDGDDLAPYRELRDALRALVEALVRDRA